MGVDAMIYVKAPEDWEYEPIDGFTVLPVKENRQTEATHHIDTMMRYYGPAYERGHWPAICHVLLELVEDPDVEKVWYFGDHSDVEDMQPISIEEILEITDIWLKHGTKPYTERMRTQ